MPTPRFHFPQRRALLPRRAAGSAAKHVPMPSPDAEQQRLMRDFQRGLQVQELDDDSYDTWFGSDDLAPR